MIGGSADGWPRGAGLPVAASPELVLRDVHGSPTVRVIGSPVRGQLTESPAHALPAATHTTEGVS